MANVSNSPLDQDGAHRLLKVCTPPPIFRKHFLSPHPHQTPCQITVQAMRSQSRGRQTSKAPKANGVGGVCPLKHWGLSRAFASVPPVPFGPLDVLLQKFMLPLGHPLSHLSRLMGSPTNRPTGSVWKEAEQIQGASQECWKTSERLHFSSSVSWCRPPASQEGGSDGHQPDI